MNSYRLGVASPRKIKPYLSGIEYVARQYCTNLPVLFVIPEKPGQRLRTTQGRSVGIDPTFSEASENTVYKFRPQGQTGLRANERIAEFGPAAKFRGIFIFDTEDTQM
jgi:hypothetical protein